MKKNVNRSAVIIDGGKIRFNDIIAVARYGVAVKISKDATFVRKMKKTRDMLMQSMRTGIPIYGVTTGYGKSCGKRMPFDIALKNGVNILRFHGCGTGEPIGVEETRAAMVCRMICLARGYSGVSIALLQQIADFLNHGITPIVPCEGSVGASGDLTPMSYIAATLMGERDVIYR
ncbi:MAG TPA: aromatic amino acid lyase, partial [Smithella sp.]|nr:aromatic amino acid lyase [Smithella sp.]